MSLLVQMGKGRCFFSKMIMYMKMHFEFLKTLRIKPSRLDLDYVL